MLLVRARSPSTSGPRTGSSAETGGSRPEVEAGKIGCCAMSTSRFPRGSPTSHTRRHPRFSSRRTRRDRDRSHRRRRANAVAGARALSAAHRVSRVLEDRARVGGRRRLRESPRRQSSERKRREHGRRIRRTSPHGRAGRRDATDRHRRHSRGPSRLDGRRPQRARLRRTRARYAELDRRQQLQPARRAVRPAPAGTRRTPARRPRRLGEPRRYPCRHPGSGRTREEDFVKARERIGQYPV